MSLFLTRVSRGSTPNLAASANTPLFDNCLQVRALRSANRLIDRKFGCGVRDEKVIVVIALSSARHVDVIVHSQDINHDISTESPVTSS